jgi:hypothetical protein
VARDGFLYRGGEDFIKARPKLDEVEQELRAQIQKCLATGLRFWYIDSHMSSGCGKDRPDIAALYPRLAAEYRLLFTQDPDGRYSGAKFVPAALESWKTQRLPDGTLVCWAVPGMPFPHLVLRLDDDVADDAADDAAALCRILNTNRFLPATSSAGDSFRERAS